MLVNTINTFINYPMHRNIKVVKTSTCLVLAGVYIVKLIMAIRYRTTFVADFKYSLLI